MHFCTSKLSSLSAIAGFDDPPAIDLRSEGRTLYLSPLCSAIVLTVATWSFEKDGCMMHGEAIGVICMLLLLGGFARI